MMGTDDQIRRSLTYLERLYTPAGLKQNPVYQTILAEAIERGIRIETLTEEQLAVRTEMEGPGLDRRG